MFERIFPKHFYSKEDENLPINCDKYWSDRAPNVTISGKKYQIIGLRGRPMDFMFKSSPVNELLKTTLKERLKDFFKQRKSYERKLQIVNNLL